MKNKILSNTYAQLSLAVAAVGGLISDEIGQGYWVALLLAGLLFLYAIYDEKKNLKIYTQNNLPIPLVFNVSNPADSKSALSILFTLLEKEFPEHQANLRKHFNIIENDLIFKYDGDIFNEKRFVDFLKISKHNIKKLEAQTPKNVDFHVVYIGPISSAIMVGTLFGTEGVTLYQYNKSSNSYNTVLEIDSREYKESVTTFKVIEKETIGTITDTVTVAIDMASHKVALSELEGAVVHLKSKLGAT
ncbi:MAG TPA: SAVED domain-containing protein, partial [Arcobacter sp.]|nr:SAVED domain-containing protein [Arcobacter sp.]